VKATLTTHDRAGMLFARLLYLTDSETPDVADASGLLLGRLKATSGSHSGGASSSLDLIADQLSGGQPPISILSIVDLAVETFKGNEDKSGIATSLLPNKEQWQEALIPHLQHKRPTPLSISSPLQGLVFALEGSDITLPTNLRYDAEDFSMMFRLTLYAVKLCSTSTILESADSVSVTTLYEFLPLALQLVNEKLTMDSANKLWQTSSSEVADEASDILMDGNTLIQSWLSQPGSDFRTMWMDKALVLNDLKIITYLNASTCSDIITRVAEKDGATSLANHFDAEIKKLRRSGSFAQAACIACGLRDYLCTSNNGRRVINELISVATELKVDQLAIATMNPLVVLNIILNGDSEALEGVQSQRLVFLMQNLVKLLSSATLDMLVESEILKLLAVVLPATQDVYGDHWQGILDTLVSTWTELNDLDTDLSMLYSTLRLYQKLSILAATEDVNEDLQDAWKSSAPQLEQSLLQCLQLFNARTSEINQPKQTCALLLGRLLQNARVKNIEPLFPLLSSPTDAVVQATYQILHRAVPARQEQLSVELVLEKQTVSLPPELLSLLSDGDDSVASWKRCMLGWKLVFDHFENTSYKLAEMYVANIKDAAQLPRLLDFVCDFMRITDSRHVDASKFDFTSFTPGKSESEEREMLWLCVHLYYCALLRLPSLVKAWYLEQKNRIKSPLEAWTQKHITSAIVAAAFDTVTAWAQTQDRDDSPVEIKANARSSELVASMEIDPESPPISISIVLPSAYPLNQPEVISRTRVAVSEKNWQSWLHTIQIIIFTTGSIIEGLVAFHRNVQGALKGQGECAICYSIIGTDMQTPNKKCGTCKNMFHGACLFRWFKSSNSSTCPLCRNSFSYA
jgi:E3 ubiquitin-protein ligase listerin